MLVCANSDQKFQKVMRQILLLQLVFCVRGQLFVWNWRRLVETWPVEATMCPPLCLIGATEKVTGSALRTPIDSKRIPCVAGVRSPKVFATIGEDGRSLPQPLQRFLVPTGSPLMVSYNSFSKILLFPLFNVDLISVIMEYLMIPL